MNDPDLRAVRAELATVREQLRAEQQPSAQGSAAASGTFPRSHTMRWLLSGRGAAGLTALVTLALGWGWRRPISAASILRRVPVSTIGRMLVAHFANRARVSRGPR